MIAITTMNKIPEYCYDCPCHDGNNGKCNAANMYSSDDRPNWCPMSDAIPVEWLKQKRDSQSDPWDYLANAIDYILAVYKKEQEAR